MTVVLGAGALIAIDRRDRAVGAILRLVQRLAAPLVTSGAVVAQANSYERTTQPTSPTLTLRSRCTTKTDYSPATMTTFGPSCEHGQVDAVIVRV